jgi:CBS-domain-containing membrane protein
MLSDRDLQAFYGDIGELEGVIALRRQPYLETPVSQHMSSDVVAVGTETDIVELINLMLESRIGAVPVAPEEGHLARVISYVDLLRTLQRTLERAARA